MAAADYRLMTEATGQRIATALESLVNLGDPVTVAHGGSGLSASPSMLVNLAASAAANVMQASPRPGVTGVLPIANGGTGAATVHDALTKLFNDTAWTEITSTTGYPTQAGVYRTTGTNPFSNMTLSGANTYGVLVIFAVGYGMHLYVTANNKLFYGYSGSSGGLVEPTTWYQLSGTAMS